MRQLHRLFLDVHKEDIARCGGKFTRYSFERCRKERHLDLTHGSLYNCELHVLAQKALECAKAFMQREHVPAHCNENGYKRCKLIDTFPETAHNFVNQKFKNCRQRNPDLICLDNECDICKLDQSAWLEKQLLDAGFDLSDERFEDSEPLCYAVFETCMESRYSIHELKYRRDKSVKEVLALWSEQLSQIPAHQHEQWRVDEVEKAVLDVENPALPAHAALVHIDYQEKLKMSQADMIPTQQFGRRLVSAFTQVIDTLWTNVESDELKEPSEESTNTFKKKFCRISVHHFCKESSKHGAQTAAKSLEILFAYLLRTTKGTVFVLILSDGSPKEFCNIHFLLLLIWLSAMMSEKLGPSSRSEFSSKLRITVPPLVTRSKGL